MNKLPVWFRQKIPNREILERMRLLCDSKVHTVCQEARCPNLSRCFDNQELTFIILGDVCTRNCRFCAVKKSGNNIPAADKEEAEKISRMVRQLALDYVVITSVTRDDLADGGAEEFARVITAVKRINKDIKVEVLIPDFLLKPASIKKVADAHPEVIGHNLETVKPLYKELRPQADYRRSLEVLKTIKEIDPSIITKSSLMLGVGEKKDEVIGAINDLRASDCDILVLGQYLAPSLEHYPVKEFVDIKQFMEYKNIAFTSGFRAVLSEPLARSSYRAKKMYEETLCMI